MAAYTTLDLISSVQNRIMLPSASSGSFSPAVILALATEELQGPIVQLIQSAREEYYETYQDTSIVAGRAAYSIPSRSIGQGINVAQYIVNSSIYELPRLESSEVSSQTQGTSRGFYFQNSSVVLYPTPAQSTGVLRIRFFQRPSTLVQTINCGQITAFDPIGLTVTVAAVPSAWTTGTIIDFIPQAVPNTPYSLNTAITGISGNVISFAAIPSATSVGDWLSITETTPIPELMRELFVVLAQATACKILEASGSLEALGQAQAKLQAYIQSALKMIQPRDQLTPKKVVSNWRNY